MIDAYVGILGNLISTFHGSQSAWQVEGHMAHNHPLVCVRDLGDVNDPKPGGEEVNELTIL